MVPIEDHLKTIKLLSLIMMILMGLAILNLPYGYYTFLRVATLICSGFVIMNFYYLSKFENPYIYGAILILILWNPIFPIYMERSTWVFFNLMACIFFGFLFYKIKV